MSSVSDSTSCWRSSTRSLRLESASAAGAQAAIAAHAQMMRIRARMSVNRLSGFVLALAARPIAADECEEHVVRVVPVGAVDVQRRSVARGAAELPELEAELLVGIAELGHGDPRDAGLPLVEALGDGLQPLRPRAQLSRLAL